MPIVDDLVPYLESWIDVRRDYMVKRGARSEYFFINTQCVRLTTDSIRGTMHYNKQKLGIVESFSPHKGRHLACSTALQNGVDPATCKDIFGWSDFKIMTGYAHGAKIQKARDMMNKKFKYGGDADGCNPAPIIRK